MPARAIFNVEAGGDNGRRTAFAGFNLVAGGLFRRYSVSARNETNRRAISNGKAIGATDKELAAQLGITDRRVRQIWRSICDGHVSPDVDRVRAEIDHDIVTLKKRHMRAALTGDIPASELCRKLNADRAKLWGANAPTKHEVNLLDAVDREIARLAEELERAAAGNAPGEAGAAGGLPAGEASV